MEPRRVKCKGVCCCVIAAWHCVPTAWVLCGYPHGSINYLQFYNALLNWFYLYRESVFNVNVNTVKLLSWIFATGLITFCISPFEHEATMRRWLHTQTADCRRWTIDLNRRLSGHKWSIIDCQEGGFKNPVSRFPEPPRQSAECRALHCSVWWHRSHCVQMISSTHTSHYTTHQTLQEAETLIREIFSAT